MGYSITQATPSDDQEELISLINRNFKKNNSQWFNWSHNQNPFGENYCWLAHEESAGKLIGSTGLLTRRMCYDGKPFAVGQTESINIDKEHRSAQAALKLQRALIAHLPHTDFNFVYGMTDTATAVFKRCRYREVGIFQHWVKPIRTEYKFKDRISSPLVRKGVACLADLGLRLYSQETRTFLPHQNKINFDAPIDERFETLFREHSEGLVMVERTREFLEWRFRQEPSTRYQIMTLEDRNQRLLGYMVFVLGETGRGGDYAAGIQDFFYRDLKSFRLMLTAFSGYCRQIGMEAIVINYFGRDEISKLLTRFGFFQRHSQTNVFVYPNPECHDFPLEPILDENHWLLTNAELLS